MDTLEDLIARAQNLLSEVNEFLQLSNSLRNTKTRSRGFVSAITEELSALRRAKDDSKSNNEESNSEKAISCLDEGQVKPQDGPQLHVLQSSNLPFLEKLWDIVKGCHNVTALQRRLPLPHGSRSNGKTGVFVDAVTDNHSTWIKLSMVTSRRILFDLAKEGWDSDEDYGQSEIPLIKMVHGLSDAANDHLVRGLKPKVKIFLPRIHPGDGIIDGVLSQCRQTGAEIFCADDCHEPPPLEVAMRNMVSDPTRTLTDTLNIDCTILLALVSDFSHARVTKQPWFDGCRRWNVDSEDREQLLPSLMYPVLCGRQLVCTQEASTRMREIVDAIGTRTERLRTAILLGDEPEAAVVRMQELSITAVPQDLRLPIKIVDQNVGNCHSNLPKLALEVMQDQSPINQSIFLYGWAAKHTTVTSNRAVVKHIESALERLGKCAAGMWPSFWLCPTARSLVGREKVRRGATAEHVDLAEALENAD
ncbi:hypothetical protein K470DRAFT_143564 [Piedraia hortae CBS 480.64]|uniref:Uncharacterized protein n=1 Tax=Piedraia hortae CBS 480.64 TaxID=1314780 RepID=A0A6A7C701_9PEZI|nr:hypothetical protein K470DRAFT_143564 [Piedraia hortae CBS 480.64]